MRKSEIWTEIKNTDSRSNERTAATRCALAICQKPTTTKRKQANGVTWPTPATTTAMTPCMQNMEVV